MTPLLDIDKLRISFPPRRGAPLVPVDEVSLHVAPGEWVALVGESGCGKSLTGLAIPRLLPPGATFGAETRIRLLGEDITALPERELRRIRGRRVAMVFQDPATSLNPVMRIGAQFIEAIRAHPDLVCADPRQRAIELLAEVGIADPARRVDAWPHQLSGGMRQRVMLAIALATDPALLIADEPTTALDVTVQAQILELLDHLRRSRGMAILLITHDLGIVAGRADRVLVMYAGRIAEMAPTEQIFATPMHPYTRGLFGSIPRLEQESSRLTPIPGSVPPPDRWPSGCRFHPRCPLARDVCRTDAPLLHAVTAEHRAACWVTTGLVP